MSETTSEQLAEIDRDMADIERQVAELVEEAQQADYPQPEPVQVCEGRWRTRRGDIKTIRPCEPLQGAYFVWPWTDGFKTYQDNGRHLAAESDNDLVEYLGPIEPDKTQEPETKTQELPETGEESPDQLIGRISLLRQRVKQLEELVGSLRTINEAQEKTIRAAGQENADLQHRLSVVADQWWEQAGTISGLQTQLTAVKAELVTQADTSRRLRIELDAAQQVPQAVSDRFEEGWDAGTSQAVETIAEWTEPFRTCGSQALALAVMANLPHIMRSLTGLTPED